MQSLNTAPEQNCQEVTLATDSPGARPMALTVNEGVASSVVFVCGAGTSVRGRTRTCPSTVIGAIV